MKELIYVTGQIDSPFFTNEIGYFCKTFDKVHVLLYKDNIEKCDELSQKYGFTYQFINTVSERIRSLPKLLKWKKREYVIEEKNTVKGSSISSIKKRAYIILYGLFAVSAERIINQHTQNGDEIYLYSFWLSRPAFAIASINYNRSNKVKRIASRVHRYDLYEEENNVGYLPFRKFISENLDVIYFSSRDTAEYYNSKKYSDRSLQALRKLSYLGTNEPEKKKESRNAEKLTIASCAYMIQRKRLDLIIKVVFFVAQMGYRVKWIHIGNGELEGQIKELAKSTFLGSSVEYEFAGRLPDEEIYELYNRENVDFFINMSDSEGIPVSVLEALSMGIPCIARNVGGNADAVINKFDGFLISKDAITDRELQELAKNIGELYANEAEYMRISKNAIMHWDKVFSGKNNAQKVCEDLINNSTIVGI